MTLLILYRKRSHYWPQHTWSWCRVVAFAHSTQSLTTVWTNSFVQPFHHPETVIYSEMKTVLIPNTNFCGFSFCDVPDTLQNILWWTRYLKVSLYHRAFMVICCTLVNFEVNSAICHLFCNKVCLSVIELVYQSLCSPCVCVVAFSSLFEVLINHSGLVTFRFTYCLSGAHSLYFLIVQCNVFLYG